MADHQREVDVESVARILESLAIKDLEGNKNEVKDGCSLNYFNFKDNFSLNHVPVSQEVVFIQGLEDIVGSLSSEQPNSLLIVSKKVNTGSKKFDNDESDSTGDISNTSAEDTVDKFPEIELGSHDFKTQTNRVDVYTEEVIKAGPSSSATVQFLVEKSKMQTSSSTSVTRVVKVDSLASLSLKDARYVVSVFTQAVRKLKSTVNKNKFSQMVFPWVFVKCNCESLQNIRWICCTVENNATEGKQSGVLRTCLVKEESSVFDLQKSFAKNTAPKIIPGEKNLYFSRYDILGSIFKRDASECRNSSMMLIEFAWHENTAPNSPPPFSADALAKLRIVPSDPSSPLAPLFLELIQLENVVHGVQSCIWPDTNYTGEVRVDVINHLQSFVDDLKNVKCMDDFVQNEEKPGDNNNNDDLAATLLAHVLDNFKRKDCDFSDNLWDFLRNASSFKDILVALDHIFTSICTKDIQPVFDLENGTELATWIREFYKASMNNKGKEELQEKLDLVLENNSKVFQLIAEAGLEKYKRSYVSFFTNEELATFGQLEPILKNAVSLEEKMALIWKLHHSLELVSFGKAYLHLSTDYLRVLLKASLDYHKGNDVPTNPPVFSLSVPAVSSLAAPLVEECRNMKPVLWKCVTNTVSGNQGKISSMFIVSKFNDLRPDVETEYLKNDDVEIHTVQVAKESKMRIF